jgi:hypothetical protein
MTTMERRVQSRAIAEEAQEWMREMRRHPQTMSEVAFDSGLEAVRLTDGGFRMREGSGARLR